MLKDNQYIELLTDDDYSCGERKSLKEAYLLLQDCKRLDKKEKITEIIEDNKKTKEEKLEEIRNIL